MQIEFNTSRIAKPEAGSPPAKAGTPAAATDTTSFTASASLEAQLRNLPAARPDKVAHARALLATPGYPSDEVLDRVATHLASKTQDS